MSNIHSNDYEFGFRIGLSTQARGAERSPAGVAAVSGALDSDLLGSALHDTCTTPYLPPGCARNRNLILLPESRAALMHATANGCPSFRYFRRRIRVSGSPCL